MSIQSDRFNKLNLKEMFYYLANRWIILVAMVIIAFISSLAYTLFFVTPLYDSTGKIYIMNRGGQSISSSDMSVSSYLTKDFENLMTDRAVLDEVAKKLKNKYSYSQLKSYITIDNPDGTRFLEIFVRTPNAIDSKKIVDALCEVSQDKIISDLDSDGVNIIRKGNIASKPSVPNFNRNILNSIVFSVCLFVAVFCAIYILDDKINTADDIEKYLELSVLGNIPYNRTNTSKNK